MHTAVIERNTVERLVGIDDEVMPQRQNVGEQVEGGVHGFGREGDAGQ